jgi:protease I
MSNVAIVLADDFEDVEFTQPYEVLVDRGHHVTVVASDAGATLTGKRGEVTHDADRAANEVNPADFDALVIPGGYSPDKLRTDDDMVRFVKGCADQGIPIAAICHAPSLLIEADLVKGRTLTSWPSIRTDLTNAGAAWMDQDVVTDGNLITSRNPDDLPAFTTTLLEWLDGENGAVGSG